MSVPESRGAPRLMTVAQVKEAHPALDEGRLRGMILKADKAQPGYEGLRGAIVRIGRSVYLDETRLASWLEGFRAAAPAAPRNPHGRGAPKVRP